MILAIDTAQMTYSVATSTGIFSSWQDITLSLLDQTHDIPPANLTGIIINVGPGRFSGIRSGIAFALGLARSLSIPLYAVSHTQLLAHKVHSPLPFTIVIDARRNQAYLQGFNANSPTSDIQLVDTSVALLQQDGYPVYGNIEGCNQINTDAEAMIQYFNQAAPAPTPLDTVEAIYIRNSVD